MAFEPENDLERALLATVTDHTKGPDFYRRLLDSDVLVAGTVQGHEEAHDKFDLPRDAHLNLFSGEDNGVKFLPVFSSLTRMQAYVREETKYLTISCRHLMEITRGASICLNPGSDFAKMFSPQELDQLLVVPKPRQPKTIIGEADYPTELVDALTVLFEKRPDIVTAWMIQVTFADRAREPHPLVGVEFDSETGGAMGSLMPEIERMAEATMPGLVFDVQRVNRKHQMGMADALLMVPPFYHRGQPPSGVTLN